MTDPGPPRGRPGATGLGSPATQARRAAGAPRTATRSGPPGGARRGPLPPVDEPMIDPGAASKGVLIVVLTFVVGVFVFWQGLHKPPTPVDETPTDAVAGLGPTSSADLSPSPPLTSGGFTSTSGAAPTSAGPPATRTAPAQLRIVVGNAVDANKPIATTVSSKLRAGGYSTLRSLNVATPSDRSFVYYATEDGRDDARGVARLLGLADADVALLPNPSPVADREAKVVVLVGREPRALSEPSGPAATTTTKR